MPVQDLIKKLIEEIKKTILLEEPEKKYWLENLGKMPQSLLQKFLLALESKNIIVEEYILTALKNDPDNKYHADLKARILKIKETAFAMDEKGDVKNAEDDLLKQIQNL